MATNSVGTSYGADKTFLTKPIEPGTFTITNSASGTLHLTWTLGTGANRTLIRGKLGSYPTSITDGLLICNLTSAVGS